MKASGEKKQDSIKDNINQHPYTMANVTKGKQVCIHIMRRIEETAGQEGGKVRKRKALMENMQQERRQEKGRLFF